MQELHNHTHGLGLLLDLNWDRVLYVGMITLSLGASAWISATFG